jgi:hypothetical protein
MAKSFVGNPNRNTGAGMSAHCRNGRLNDQSAATLRELATYHQKLAGGTPSAPPAAQRASSGAGASNPPSRS